MGRLHCLTLRSLVNQDKKDKVNYASLDVRTVSQNKSFSWSSFHDCKKSDLFNPPSSSYLSFKNTKYQNTKYQMFPWKHQTTSNYCYVAVWHFHCWKRYIKNVQQIKSKATICISQNKNWTYFSSNWTQNLPKHLHMEHKMFKSLSPGKLGENVRKQRKKLNIS